MCVPSSILTFKKDFWTLAVQIDGHMDSWDLLLAHRPHGATPKWAYSTNLHCRQTYFCEVQPWSPGRVHFIHTLSVWPWATFAHMHYSASAYRCGDYITSKLHGPFTWKVAFRGAICPILFASWAVLNLLPYDKAKGNTDVNWCDVPSIVESKLKWCHHAVHVCDIDLSDSVPLESGGISRVVVLSIYIGLNGEHSHCMQSARVL